MIAGGRERNRRACRRLATPILAGCLALLPACMLGTTGLELPDAESPEDAREGGEAVDTPSDVPADDDGAVDAEPEDGAIDDGAPDGDDDGAIDDAPPDIDIVEDAPVDDAPVEDVLPDIDVADDAPVEDVADVGCPGDCSGHGTCTAGICRCDTGYEPPACDRCALGFTGYPTCVPCGGPGRPCCGTACQEGLECVVGTCRPACPMDMARIGSGVVCIDRYEASPVGDAAVSAPGNVPWASITRWDAERACIAAGKRMCTAAEWQTACQGPLGFAYPYGAAFVAGSCNDRNGTSCPRDGSGVAPTGTFAACQGGYAGIFDMSGNVWEWVWDTSSGRCGLRGGSVDSCRDATMLSCANVAWQDCDLRWPGLGFRCCLTL